MQITLQRQKKKPEYTAGILTVNDRFRWPSLEPGTKGKGPIPAGRYKITMYDSPRFKRAVPLLHDVPGFTYIEIHWGNWPRETRGCPMIGVSCGKDGAWLNWSKQACDILFNLIQNAIADGQEVWIEVKD